MTDKRKIFAVAGGLLLLAAAAAFLIESSSKDIRSSNTTWRNAELTEVNSGENFSIEQLDKPVLVETFAVWCPTCTRQQQEVQKLHEMRDDFVSVSLDTDPNEDAEKVRKHTARHSFDWYYAIADPQVALSLRDEFGSGVLNPPSVPMILVCEDGDFRRLPNGVKPASKLSNELDEGC